MRFMKDSERKAHLAAVTDRYVKGQMGRREFLRAAGYLGLGAGVLGMGMKRNGMGLITPAYAQDKLEPSAEVISWLK